MPSFGGWKVKIHICQDAMGYSIGLGGMKIPATCCAFVARLFMRYKCVYMTMIVVHICKLHSATPTEKYISKLTEHMQAINKHKLSLVLPFRCSFSLWAPSKSFSFPHLFIHMYILYIYIYVYIHILMYLHI